MAEDNNRFPGFDLGSSLALTLRHENGSNQGWWKSLGRRLRSQIFTISVVLDGLSPRSDASSTEYTARHFFVPPTIHPAKGFLSPVLEIGRRISHLSSWLRFRRPCGLGHRVFGCRMLGSRCQRELGSVMFCRVLDSLLESAPRASDTATTIGRSFLKGSKGTFDNE